MTHEGDQGTPQPTPKAVAAWQFFQQMLGDVTKIVTPDHLYELGPQPPLLLEDN